MSKELEHSGRRSGGMNKKQADQAKKMDSLGKALIAIAITGLPARV